MLDCTLASHFENLYKPHRLTGKSPNTVRIFRCCLRRLDLYLHRPSRLTDLTDDTLRGVMGDILDNGRSIPTANQCRAHLVALWNFLSRKGLVDIWPTVQPLTEPRREPTAWTRDELARLWTACEKQTGMIGKAPAPVWWHSLHALAWDSAERISALMGLEWSYVDLAGGWVLFRAEIRKGKRADLRCRIHADTAAVLAQLQVFTLASGRVLPWGQNPNYMWTRYKNLRASAGLPVDKDHAFHCLRKSVASYFEAVGGNATKLLGHSNRRVTERYLDSRIVQQQWACDSLFRPGDDVGRVG